MSDQPWAGQALFFSSQVIWLVPNDLVRFQLLQTLPATVAFPADQAPRLETFTSLESRLLNELIPAEIDDLARSFILYELARPLAAHLWPEDPAVELTPADLKALANELGDGLNRLKLAGLAWDQLASLPPPELGRLLADLGRRHDSILTQTGRLDHFSRRRQVLEELRAGRPFQALAGVEKIVCRWSQRLSPFETDFILALARDRQVRLTLTVPAWVRDENIDHGAGFDLLRSIRQIEHCPEPTLWLDFAAVSDGPTHPALAYAAESLLAPLTYRQSEPPDPAGRLNLLRLPTAYHEVEEAARRVKERLLAGIKPEQLALVAHDLSSYGPLIDDVGRRFGLNFHFRRGATLADRGPARAVLDLLALWSSHWERTRWLELIRSPYFYLPQKPGDFSSQRLDPAELNRLTLAAGITDHRAGGGFEDNLTKLIKPGPGPDSRLAGRLYQVLTELQADQRHLAGLTSWPAFIAEFKKILRRLGWPGHPVEAQAVPADLREDDLDATLAFNEELGRLNEVLTTTPYPPEVTLANFRLWLETQLAERRLDQPQSPGGRVRVLNYYDLHGGFFEEIFFLGLNERLFPDTGPGARWWPEELVRGAAKLLGRPLWNDPADRYRQEELMLAAGLAQARERVWLFHHALDESGREALPSPLLGALTDLWPDGRGGSRLQEQTLDREGAVPLELVAGPDELRAALMKLSPADWPDGLDLQGEYRKMRADLIKRRDDWRSLARLASPGPLAVTGWLSRRPAHQGAPLISPSFLADFKDCPLSFLAREILGLSPDGEAIEELAASSEGNLIHRVLEQFFSARLGPDGEPGPPWPGLTDLDRDSLELKQLLEAALTEMAATVPLGRRPLWELRRRQLSAKLEGWLKRELAGNREPTRPWRLEWFFGSSPNAAAPPWALQINEMETIYFQGRVDRLDKTGGRLTVRDYKLRDRDSFHIKKNGELPTGIWPLLTYTLAAATAHHLPAEACLEIIDPAFRDGRIQGLATDSPKIADFTGQLTDTWRQLQVGAFPAAGNPETQCRWCALTLFCSGPPTAETEADNNG